MEPTEIEYLELIKQYLEGVWEVTQDQEVKAEIESIEAKIAELKKIESG